MLFLLMIGCNENGKSSNQHTADSEIENTEIEKYQGELLKVTDIPNACEFMTEERIKGWYDLNEIKWLSKPSNQGLVNSCNTAFFAQDMSTDLGIQVYGYNNLEEYNTDIEVLEEMNFEKVNSLEHPAFWSGGNVYQKALTIFYKGLKIIVTQPSRDAYDEATHKKRAIAIAKEYLSTI